MNFLFLLHLLVIAAPADPKQQKSVNSAKKPKVPGDNHPKTRAPQPGTIPVNGAQPNPNQNPKQMPKNGKNPQQQPNGKKPNPPPNDKKPKQKPNGKTPKPKPPPKNDKNKQPKAQGGKQKKALDLKTTLQYITEGIGTGPQALNLSTSLRAKAMEYLKANSTRIGSVVNSHDFESASCGFIEKSHLTPHFLGTPMDDAIKHVQSQIQPKQKRHIRLYRRHNLFKRRSKAGRWWDKHIANPANDKLIKPAGNFFEHTLPDQLDKHVGKPLNDGLVKPVDNFFEHTLPDGLKKAGRNLKKGWKDFTNAFKSPENFKRALKKLGEVSKKAWNKFVEYVKEYKNELIITAALIAVALATAVVITLAPEFAPFLTEFALEAGAEIGGEAAAEGVVEAGVEGAAEVGAEAGAGGAAEGGSSALQTTKQIFGNARKIYDAVDDIRGDVEDAIDNAQQVDQITEDIINPQEEGYDEGYEEESEQET